ncbi:hypothetical protein WME73_22980 [Sorangium sp. So ce302]|uniref:hypothetical protein n=1 Tax=unclassified Sorangium TaxID=2621164 RepID=UPI003F62B692
MKQLFKLLALVLAPLAIALSAQAAEKPSEIRVANPGVGVGNRPVVGGSAWSLLNLNSALESEFKSDGVPVRWNFLRGAGPAVNETYANGLTDFSLLGDLPSKGGLGRRVGARQGQPARGRVRGRSLQDEHRRRQAPGPDPHDVRLRALGRSQLPRSSPERGEA